jgi:hypothetical protein
MKIHASRLWITHLLSLISIGVSGVVLTILLPGAEAQPVVDMNLVNATPEEWKQAVLRWTKNRYEETSIQILLMRRATQVDLDKFGPSYAKNAEKDPFALVILRGKFQDSAGKMSPSNFLVYVLDLKAGLPTTISGSWTGENIREVLNMPNLGKEIPPLPPKIPEPPNRAMGLW